MPLRCLRPPAGPTVACVTESASEPPTVTPWNVPNALTMLRLVLVPLFAWLLLRDGGANEASRVGAFAVFIVASITDYLDGAIARKQGLVTTFGKIVDPIADKALTGVALVGLSVLDELPWWVTLIVLVREIGITLMRFIVIRHGVMPAGHGGKTKTALQIVAISLYLLPLPSAWHPIEVGVMAAAVVTTVLTGLDYILSARRMRQGSERTAMKRARRGAS